MKPFLKKYQLYSHFARNIHYFFFHLLNGRIINGFDLIKLIHQKINLVLGASRTQTAVNDHIIARIPSIFLKQVNHFFTQILN